MTGRDFMYQPKKVLANKKKSYVHIPYKEKLTSIVNVTLGNVSKQFFERDFSGYFGGIFGWLAGCIGGSTPL